MKKSFSTVTLLSLCMLTAQAQPKFSRQHGLYEVSNLTVAITTEDDEATIHYTTDGSEPLPTSPMYTTPLVLNTNTLLRAVEVKADTVASPITTATYLFMNHVLRQSDTPKGYPTQWGSFTQMGGTAQADYGMDEEMTTDVTLRPKIVEGLKSLPILSIVTDKENLFSHEADSALGGIYIFTGPPVGDATGHGWTRPASIELMGGGHDLSAACGLRLHGGHGRLAEKNPKHSFRLVFKDEYGEKTLKYPLFGEDEPNKFDQLVVRCHFGNAWQHWSESNRQKAQYTRDVWARRMQRKMGAHKRECTLCTLVSQWYVLGTLQYCRTSGRPVWQGPFGRQEERHRCAEDRRGWGQPHRSYRGGHGGMEPHGGNGCAGCY